MTKTYGQTNQDVNDAGLKNLGTLGRDQLNVLFDKLNTEFNSPFKLSATYPAADSKLNFATAIVSQADGSNKAMAPIKSQVFSLAASTIDFQTQATTGATFVISWPASNTLNYFRRIGFTLLGNGTIQALVSVEAASVGALVNPGTLFVKSGAALGYIDLKCTDTLGKWKTANSTTSIIENADIYRFGSGSGGGSGTGNANSFEDFLAIRLDESYYQFATPVIFEVSEQAQISAATAAYNLVDATYDFALGNSITSVQMFNPSFLALVDEARQVELHAEWYDSSSVDTAATYEASLNGGLAWQTLSMGQVLSTNKFIGKILLDTPTDASLYTQATNNSTKELNITTQQSLAQKVTLTGKNGIRQILLNITKAGTNSGSFIIKLSSDNAGTPGTVLYSSIALVSSLNAGANAVTLSGFKNILTAGDYWISIETDATYKSSFVTVSSSIALGVASAVSGYTYNGTTWSTLAGGGMYYVLMGHVYDLRVRITASANSKKLKAFGVLFDEQVGAIEEGLFLQQSFIFSGDANQYQFSITRFLPDSRRLRVYDVTSGQCYVYPAFNIDGKTITFPSGTFSSPGNQMNLLFDQSNGAGFDNSDNNASLLVSNHLGSFNPTVDRSTSGRGILLRNSAGVLKEIWLDSQNNVNVTDYKG